LQKVSKALVPATAFDAHWTMLGAISCHFGNKIKDVDNNPELHIYDL
jgi:hypothetical protein